MLPLPTEKDRITGRINFMMFEQCLEALSLELWLTFGPMNLVMLS